MATVESVTTTNWADSRTSVTVAKPTGLTVGDLMVALVAVSANSVTLSATGWTSARSQENSGDGIKGEIFWKIADSGDVAASNFTFNQSGAGTGMAGAILRISGYKNNAGVVIPITGSESADNDSTPSYAFSLTPAEANAMLVFFTVAKNGGVNAANVTDYAIATSNPSWTERVELGASLGAVDLMMACATAVRPETTNTGAWSLNFNGGGTTTVDSLGIGIGIYPRQDVALSPSAVPVLASVPSQTLAASVGVAPDTITISAAVPDQTITTKDNPWSSSSKSGATGWSNLPKS